MGENFSKEISLATKLKNLCEKGKETDPSKSAVILNEFGLLYKLKSPHKISLIRSAAFLNAACIRQPLNEIFNEDLEGLCRHVLREAGAHCPDLDLVDISRKLFQKILHMRKKSSDGLEECTVIPIGLAAEEKQELEKVNKIDIIRKVQNDIAENYSDLMNSVAQVCLQAMGPAPCKYSVSGMGSLARKEITPFSDFEHIIVLEEGTQHYTNYEDILEYFRWFSVIFQIVVINFQETILRSVAVPLLNDGFIAGGDWFFDAFTPCGIKFDGMQIHACKFPLGRTQPTHKHPTTVELIKPISKMVEYLKAEEELKNGYHLADILTRTCFVSGCKEVHDSFENEVQKMLEGDGSIGLEEILTQLTENLDEFLSFSKLGVMNASSKCDIKRMVYRGSTLFISALGRLFSIKENSCFKIVEVMLQRGIITETAAHRLSYAVAIACEVRLKVYLSKNGQDDIFGTRDFDVAENRTLKELIDLVGEQSIADYFTIVHTLQMALRGNNPELLKTLDHTTKDRFIVLNSLDLKTLFDREWKEYHQNIKSNSLNDEYITGKIWEGTMKYKEGRFSEALDIFAELDEMNVQNPLLKCEIIRNRAGVLHDGRDFQKAIRYCREKIEDLKKLQFDSVARPLCHLYVLLGNCNRYLGLYKKAISVYQDFLVCADQVDPATRKTPFANKDEAACYFGLGECHLNLDDFDSAIKYTAYALDMYNHNPNAEAINICLSLNLLGRCHLMKDEFAVANSYLQKELALRQHYSSPDKQDESKEIHNCMSLIAYAQAGMLQSEVI